MSAAAGGGEQFYIGWDVGGWNCDTNAKSRDAIVILDDALGIVGRPWRGNLRETINTSTNTDTWIRALFARCDADIPGSFSHAYLGIDTPLGFSNEFTALVTGLRSVEKIGESSSNLYLFRMTERVLFEQGISPLSAVKDMIGSQATKGMHVLARFARTVAGCGIWTDGRMLTVLEAYPSACKKSATVAELAARYQPLGHEDKDDAMLCALVAYLYAEKRDSLFLPDEAVPPSEGWIWVPKDSLGMNKKPVLKVALP